MRIITIGRQFGSGGRELGKRIAEKLGIAYYDKEILTEISKKTSLAEEYITQIIERKPTVQYPITIANSFGVYDSDLNRTQNKIFAEQNNVIKELASKSDCVIVGRCADYILRDQKPFRIFVYADMESKIKRCREKGEVGENLTDRQIKREIKRVDKHRKQYYDFYTGLNWGDKENYDICINTSNKKIKDVVSELVKIFKE